MESSTTHRESKHPSRSRKRVVAPNFNAYSGTRFAEVSVLFQFDLAVPNDVFVL